jgi:hypothetical protein
MGRPYHISPIVQGVLSTMADFAAKERHCATVQSKAANQGRPSMSTTEPDEPDTDDDGPNTIVVVGDNATVNLTDDDDGEPDADDSGTTP